MRVLGAIAAGVFAATLVWQTPVSAAEETEPQDPEPPLRFSALTQTDWTIFRQSSEDDVNRSTGEPLNQERFHLRRARAGFTLEERWLFGRTEVELQGEPRLSLAPYEVHIGARSRFHIESESKPNDAVTAGSALEVALSLGLLPIPFGHDVVERVQERPVLERTTFASALFPGQRDLGAGATLRFGVLGLSVAWMNGEPVGEGRFAGLDATRMKDVVGRVGFDAGLGRELRLSAGFSGLSGQGLHPGTPETKDRLAWHDGNEDGLVELSELSVVPGTPATASEPFSRFAIGADLRLGYFVPVAGWLELRAEVVRAKNLDRGVEPADPVARGRDLRELGYCLGVAQELTKYAGIALRYDVYDPDTDDRRFAAGDVVPVDARYTTLAVALMGRFERLRVMLEYDHRTNALGVADNGTPATLADDSLTLRGELVY